MYGLVNNAIKDMVTEEHGLEKWQAVLRKANLQEEVFLSNMPYDDDITYRLAGAASEEMNTPLPEILRAFGHYWVLKTGREKYGSLMEAGGANLRAFLLNLPDFHSRIQLIYPRLKPPEFKIGKQDDRSLELHYFSEREGLQSFMFGLLEGLSLMYQEPVSIDMLQSRLEGHSHEIFKITWP